MQNFPIFAISINIISCSLNYHIQNTSRRVDATHSFHGMMLIELLRPGLCFFMVEVNKLKKADQIRGKITEFLTPKQIEELAINHSIPHYELTNPLTGSKTVWFIQDEVYEWVKSYFVRHDFNYLPELIFINFNDDGYKIFPSDDVPLELSMVKPLYKLPIANLNTPPGIYFLCNEGKVVYIGQAANIGSRILEHKRNPEKTFNSVYFICCHLDQLLRVEAACIKNFRPPLNIVHAGGTLTEGDKDILEKYLT